MSNTKRVKVGVIGLGARGLPLVNVVFLPMWENGLLEITAVCDYYEDRAEAGAKAVEERQASVPSKRPIGVRLSIIPR